MPLDFLIVYAAVREDRQEIRAARFILERCGARPATSSRAPTDTQIRVARVLSQAARHVRKAL